MTEFWEDIIVDIESNITTNNNQQITGELLKSQLIRIVNNLGSNASYAGYATPSTVPATPRDAKMVYVSAVPGTYVNFNRIVVAENEIVLLSNSKTGTWSKQTVLDLSDVKKTIATNVANIDTNKKAIAANANHINKLNKDKADLVGGIAPQSQIDPMQGRYTGFSTPFKDNDVNWKGDLSPIGTGDFTLEFAGNFRNSHVSANALIKLGIGGAGDDGVLATANFDIRANNLSVITFPFPSGGSGSENWLNVYRTYGEEETVHNIIWRSGVNVGALIQGVKYTITQDRVLDLANNLSISNAFSFSLLRKFNFADEDFAQSLWNGGRWWEKSIGKEYRGINQLTMLQNEYLPSSLTPTSWRDTAGSSDLLPTNPDKMTLLTESPFTQVLWGAGAPAIAPDFIGQLYLSDTNRVFIAKL